MAPPPRVLLHSRSMADTERDAAPIPDPAEGFRVGHARHAAAPTGCTVILCPEGTVAGVDVRGPAPGSRETALLAVDKPIARLDALLFTGGSAFGLAAADGVMRYLAERGVGHPTPVKPIPIVAASVIYDLGLSGGSVHPDAELGYAACRAARRLPVPPAAQGNAGAGTGATVGKWGGPASMMKGGVGYAERDAAGTLVAALAVVNAVGDVLGDDGRVLAGARAEDGWLADRTPERWLPQSAQFPVSATNTTLVAVLTDAAMSKPEAGRLAQRAHDGIARAVLPAHTTYDGDTAYALASGRRTAPFDLVAALAVECVSAAIRNAVRRAAPTASVTGLGRPLEPTGNG